MNETLARTTRLIQADLFTNTYRLSGKIPVQPGGLTAWLNSVTTDFLELEEVYLGRLHQAGDIAGNHEFARMVKANLLAVLLTRREDLGPRAIVRGGYTRLLSARVLVACGPYDLRGTVETPGKLDLSLLMIEGVGDFVPLYEVQLSVVLFPSMHFHGAACLFNRRHVDFLTLVGNS